MREYNPFDYNIYFVFTGDEEFNHLGVRTFLKDTARNIAPENTTIINIDSIGQSHLTAENIEEDEKVPQIWLTPANSEITGEDNWSKEFAERFFINPPLNFYIDRDGEYIEFGDEMGRSDAALFALHGFRALTISGVSRDLAMRAGIINKKSDFIKKLDIGFVIKIVDWLGGSIERIDNRGALLSRKGYSVPRLVLPVSGLRKDFSDKIIDLFSNYELRFIHGSAALPREVYKFFSYWLEYLTNRWPAYNEYFIGINDGPPANIIRAKNKIIEYGMNLALQVILDPYTHDPIFGVRYAPREVILTHEIGHFVHISKGISSRDIWRTLKVKDMRHYNNMNELLVTDFSLMFLYNKVVSGRFNGVYLDATYSDEEELKAWKAREYVDLEPSAKKRRDFNEALFEEVGVKPFVGPFRSRRSNIDIGRYIRSRADI